MKEGIRQSPFNLSVQQTSLDKKTVVALERLSEVFRVCLWEQGKKNQLSPLQIQVLVFIKYHAPINNKTVYLAKEFNVTKATMSDTIAALFKKNLVEKENDPKDSRSHFLHLTSVGKKMLEEIENYTTPLEQALSLIQTPAKELMFQNLLEIINTLNKQNVISASRMCFNCRFFEKKQNDSIHYCNLLGKKLNKDSLRIDCPEFEQP